MRDMIIDRERAEIDEMEKKLQHKKEKYAVDELLRPYKRGGLVVTYSGALDRYIIRIPTALQIDGQVKVTAATEQEVYHKAYTMLCKPATTLRDIFKLAMEERDEDPSITDQTQVRVWRDWEHYFEHSSLANRPIEEIKASEIAKFEKTVTGDYALTRHAFINIKTVLNIAYNYAVCNDIVAINIARDVKIRAKCRTSKKESYTDEQREIVLRYIEDHHKFDDSICYAAIYLDFYLCARIGEIKALRWTDYDAEAGTLRIEREVVTRDGKQVAVEHTKGGEHGSRTEYIDEPEVIAMLEHLKEHRNSMLIFPSERGDYLSTGVVNKALKRLSNWTGIPYMSSHKIRFWAVTKLTQVSGGDITTVGTYAGHHNKQTTLGYVVDTNTKKAQRGMARQAFKRKEA